ncbi:CRAL-TRIO lipid binding domain [Trypanosoma melophagium]|uniref:CRAL-TRIO lipid binding domain n=1 Tax=Trypanosoma melophagium TaxID=715481 RepID=UPI003519E6FC|nr:CRAL-TRIO lipid binding domain [Trypanosoma melophagium]
MSNAETLPNSTLPSDLFLFPQQNVGFQIPFFISTEEEAARVRPPNVVKTITERMQELSDKQREIFKSFKKSVEMATWYKEAEHDDWMLIRYLFARNFEIKKSLHMLERTVQWREKNAVDEWVCERCLADPNHHMMQFVGWDLIHRPVCFMSMRWGPDRKEPLRHCVSTFRHLEKLMPAGVEQWVCVTDFETFSYLRDSSPNVALAVVKTIQDHFPERLGLMILVNPPTSFGLLWKMLAPVMEEKTRKKVLFLYTNSKPSAKEEFRKLFPPLLSQYLYETYTRSKKGDLPTTPIWYPTQVKDTKDNDNNKE